MRRLRALFLPSSLSLPSPASVPTTAKSQYSVRRPPLTHTKRHPWQCNDPIFLGQTKEYSQASIRFHQDFAPAKERLASASMGAFAAGAAGSLLSTTPSVQASSAALSAP